MAASSNAHEYVASNPKSRALFEDQKRMIPGGVTHAARAFEPFPLFIDRCHGSKKWDVDGNEYIDYWMGHGANILGHAHPLIVEAVTSQIARGSHAGGETELGARWASLIIKLIPSAEQVRFTSSGGEATQLAIRLARAYTDREKLLKFEYGFHGWHDVAAVGYSSKSRQPPPGVSRAVSDAVITVPLNDFDAARAALQHGDVAGVILEPGGVYSDTIPADPEFVRWLREETADRGTLLIFDEVVTGFRYSVGGAQATLGILPDLTALGKILGGGLACGAVVGGSRFMAPLFDASAVPGPPKVLHTGTWNANPLVATAGVAALQQIMVGNDVELAARRATELRDGINDAFESKGFVGIAYGGPSIVKIHLGSVPRITRGDFSDAVADGRRLVSGKAEAGAAFRKAILLEGVDLLRTNGFLSSMHSEEDIQRTITAVEAIIDRCGPALATGVSDPSRSGS